MPKERDEYFGEYDEEDAPSFEVDWNSRFQIIPTSTGIYRTGNGDRVGYYTLWLQTTATTNERTKSSLAPWLLNSKGKIIHWSEKDLMMYSLSPDHGLTNFVLRWTVDDAKDVQDGNLTKPNPHEIYDMIIAEYRKYVDMSDERNYSLLALWIMGTYLVPCFDSYPFIYFGGIMQSGKTKNLKLISLISYNAIQSLSISASALFRTCQGAKATLLIDETGYLKNMSRYEDLRTLLYGRYKKGQFVQRVDKIGDRFETRSYEVFGPTALATIENLESVLEQRCISVFMQRTLNKTIANSEPNEKDPIWQTLRNSLYRLFLSSFEDFEKVLSEICEVNTVSEPLADGGVDNDNDSKPIYGRAFELWNPLFALAKWVDMFSQNEKEKTKTHDLIYSLALDLEETRKLENATETAEGNLLFALNGLCSKDLWLATKQIKTAIQADTDEELSWINTKWIGRAMKRLGFTEKRRLGTGVQYLIKRSRLDEVARRLNFALNGDTLTTQTPLTTPDNAKTETETEKGLENLPHLLICQECKNLLDSATVKYHRPTEKMGICEKCREPKDKLLIEVVIS